MSLTSNLQTFFHTIQDFLFVLDTDGCIRHVNQTVVDRLGYTESELRGRSVLVLHPPEERKEADETLRAMLKGKADACMVPLMTRGGRRIPVETRVTPGSWDGQDALFGVSKDISALKRSEEKFSRAFHGNPSLMAISRLSDGRFIDVNTAFLETTGYQRDEVIGRTAKELNLLVNPECREGAMARFAQEGRVREMEMQIRTRSGEIRDGLFSVDTIEVSGQSCWLKVMTDITDHRRSENKLAQLSRIQDRLMRLATDFVNVPVERQDTAVNQALAAIGRLIRADRAYLFSYDFEAGLMHNTHEWCGEDIAPEIDNLQNVPMEWFPEWVGAHCSGDSTHVPQITELPEGSNLREILEPQGIQSLITLPLMQEETCLGFVGFDAVRAVRRWTEEEIALLRVLAVMFANFEARRAAEAAVDQLSEERAMLLDTMDAQVWYLTDEETYGAVNRAHAEFLGMPPMDLEGKQLGEFLPASVVGECVVGNRKVYTDKQPVVTHEWLTGPDGRQRLLSITKTPKFNEQGDIEYVVCVAHDITEMKELQEKLRKALEEAQAAAQAKSMFLANMSHEIRTPLNAILGYAQIMDRDCGECPKKRRALETILRSGEHLLELIEDILSLVRCESENLPLNESDFSLLELMRDTCRMVAARPEARGLTFGADFAENILDRISADKSKVAQVLLNLVGNAAKFTEAGQIRLLAECDGCESEAGDGSLMVTVTVSDTGCGIETEQRDRIFDAFEQARNGVALGKGTGLGLALSRRYARAMGGDIRVESRLGEGSDFRFTFRAHRAKGMADRRPLEGDCPNCRLVLDGPPRRMLVVDDDAPNREMLAEMLDKVGFQTRTAASGAEAISLVETEAPFDMVLLDKCMPEPDGIETMAQMRTMANARHSRMVFVTASSLANEEEELRNRGADGFLPKPVRAAALFAEIGRLLGVRYTSDLPREKGIPKAAGSTSPAVDGGDPTEETPQLPSETVETLRNAISRGDIRRLRETVKTLAQTAPPVAAGLEPMVNAYDYDGVETFLESMGTSQGNS